jgi:hypothetical protein
LYGKVIAIAAHVEALFMSRFAAILLLVLLAVAVQAAESSPADDLVNLPSLTGLTGLVRVPTADIMPETMMRLGYNWSRGEMGPDMGGVSTYLIGIGALPGVEGSLTMGQYSQAHDFTVHGKVAVLRERGPWPAVAVGFSDLKRTQKPGTMTKFVVATRHFGDRAAVTLGAAAGNNNGPWAGASYRLGRALVLEGEYDGRRVNEGLAVRLPRDSMLRLQNIRDGVTASVSTQFNLTAPPPLPCPAPVAAPVAGDVNAAQQAVIALGLERVRVTQEAEGRLAARYENRRYTLNDRDSLCAVYAALADHAPASTRTLAATITHRGIPVLSVATGLDAFRQYRAGTLAGPAFARQLVTTTLPSAPTGSVVADSGTDNPLYGRADLLFGPGLLTQVGTDDVTLALGVFGRGELVVPVAKGAVIDARVSYPLGGPLVREVPKRLENDRLVAALAFRATPRVVGQVFGGKFPDDYRGAGAEAAMPVGSRGLLHVTVSRLRHIDWERTTGLAEYTTLLPASNTQVRYYLGRFLEGDTGGGIDITRFFNEYQIGIGIRDTTNGRLAHVRISVPLSPRRQPHAPSSLRLRTVDFYDYRVRSIITGRNYLTQAQVTGNELSTGVDLVDTLFNRARDLPAAGEAYWR